MNSLIYCKIHCLYLPIFYLVCGLIHQKKKLKALVIVIPFLSFKERLMYITTNMNNT